MTVEEKEGLLQATRAYIKKTFHGEATGHDWYHVQRVAKMALRLAQKEGADAFMVEMAALLHDVGDHKFLKEGDPDGPEQVRQWLADKQVDPVVIEGIVEIVANVSYKGAGVKTTMTSIEGKVVQDADRLDAIGAIGVARTFAYGGMKGNPIYDPEIPHEEHQSFGEYKKGGGTTVNHFYEKLLLLKERMQTESGKEWAEARHRYMEGFLTQFYAEWDSLD